MTFTDSYSSRRAVFSYVHFSAFVVLILSFTATLRAAFIDKAELTGDLVIEFSDDSNAAITIGRESLYEMGVKTEAVYIPYLNKAIHCTVLPLQSLLDAYPQYDAAFAYCYDGYISYYTPEFIAAYEPYFVLDFEGNEKGDMKLEGAPDMGPFYISFAKRLEQGSEEMLDPANKRPFGVFKIKLGTRESLVGTYYSAPFDDLDDAALAGRETWLNNCMSCHSWGEDGPGGNLSNRIVKIVSVHAKYNAKYFHDFVRDPHVTMPESKMPKHPHYSDETIEQIRQFLTHVPN